MGRQARKKRKGTPKKKGEKERGWGEVGKHMRADPGPARPTYPDKWRRSEERGAHTPPGSRGPGAGGGHPCRHSPFHPAAPVATLECDPIYIE